MISKRLTKASQSAAVPNTVQVGLQQPFKLSETVALPYMDWQRVPQAWSSNRKTPVAETVI